MRILLPTDSFPPGCGGGGLSAFFLAAGLESRGHHIDVIKLVPGLRGIRETKVEGLPVTEFGYRWPRFPGLGPLYLNERVQPLLRRYLSERLDRAPYDLVHAQHILSILPAVPAARDRGIPVVSTIRDFWPVCFWDTSLSGDEICPGCTSANLRACTRRRKPALWPASRLFISYMRYTLRHRRVLLGSSDAVICVSSWVRDAVLSRAPEIEPARVTRIPNFVDCDALQGEGGGKPQGRVIEEVGLAETPYLLYAGKLARNKGVIPMLRALAASEVKLPLAAAARGELEPEFRAEAKRLGIDLRMLGWRPNEEVLDLMRGATALLFPSLWPEPLSRALLEATAIGTPVVATATGGTTDIVWDGETGILAGSERAFAEGIARIAADAELRRKFFKRARARAREHFDRRTVLNRVEEVYAQVARRTADASA
jgi:glycogen(starch) synthase